MVKNVDPSETVRWWENYVVRYFVGTVIGAAIVGFLNNYAYSPYFGVLSSFQGYEPVSFRDIAVVGSIGFAYCYVASAPVLVTHALREYLRFWRSALAWIVLVVTVLVLGLTELIIAHHGTSALEKVGLSALVVIITLQAALLANAAIDRFRRATGFYRQLSARRANRDEAVRQYVESYRHLREHGNASWIVLLEIVLGLILVSLPSWQLGPAVLAGWMAPASLCWFMATVLEFGLADGQGP